MDLSGGWTEHFSISYENLVSRRESQLEASLIAGIDCMNGTAFWSSKIFAPRTHGSGAAPLAKLVMQGHGGAQLSPAERDLLMAWIDSNGLYHGTWDSTMPVARRRAGKPRARRSSPRCRSRAAFAATVTRTASWSGSRRIDQPRTS
jgi:hypothetical protein